MKNGIVKILAVGDVVGKCGSEYIRKNLWRIRKELDIDICIVNGENSAVGNGITKESSGLLFVSGADIITTGNHVFRRGEVYTHLDDCEKILRPANYPKGAYGFGHGVFDIGGVRVLCMNLLGTVYMESLFCPFETAKSILDREKDNYDIAICDIHAEATSEKLAFAYDFDGKIDIVFGTHTHIQTNDARVLPCGTGYITDLGMTGTEDSVLGVKKEIVIKKLKTKMPVRFEEAEGKAVFCGAVFEYDMNTKRVVSAQTITERE
jgi:metallophosphoesterase (TIGR00282 family)